MTPGLTEPETARSPTAHRLEFVGRHTRNTEGHAFSSRATGYIYVLTPVLADGPVLADTLLETIEDWKGIV